MSDDFSGFDEFLGGVKPGRKATLGGTLRYHLGADPNDWSYPGNVKYVPHDYMILVGSSKWTGGAATDGAMAVNFPAVFSGEPVVIVGVASTTPLFNDCRCQAPPSSGAAFEIYWFSALNLTQVIFHWLAIGPIATQ